MDVLDFARPTDARFLPVGHRGAPREFPPNTLAGFARAVEVGCPMVECDVRRSRDGVLVLAHDGHVADREGRRWAVGETDAATLARLDLGAGEGVPTLAALVDWAARAGASIMADMKESGDGIETEVARLLAPLPAGRKVVPGAGDDARRRFRAADPHLPLSLSLGFGGLSRGSFARLLNERDSLAVDAVTLAWALLTPRRLDALHAVGLFVFVWTVDNVTLINGFAGWGVDGIISNATEMVAQAARRTSAP